MTTDEADDELIVGRDWPHRRLSQRGWVLIIALAVLAGVGWYALRPSPPLVVTYMGIRVDNSAQLVTQGDAAFASYAHENHGAISAHSRCYFDRVGGAVRTDVSAALYCGPVLFYRGAAPALFLPFTLSPLGSTGGARITLMLTPTPTPGQPVNLRRGANLERPDGRSPPRGADGLNPPGPPPAPANLLVQVDRADLPTIQAIPHPALVGGLVFDFVLDASGFVAQYGRDASTKSAPAGQRLLAFALHVTDGEATGAAYQTGTPQVGLSVDDGAVRSLTLVIPSQDNGQTDTTVYAVAAVSVGARSVDLVVSELDVTQRVSVLTGAPAPGNIEILQRPFADRLLNHAVNGTLIATVTSEGHTFTADVRVEVDGAYLGYFAQAGSWHANGPNRALLTVTVCFRATSPYLNGEPGSCWPVGAGAVSFTPGSGGLPIRALDEGGDITFDVPASLTTGVLTIGGSGTAEGVTVRFTGRLSARIAFGP